MDFQKINTDIEKFGCSIIALEATDYLPAFAHTIGLWQQYQHPEIIIFGLPPQQMQSCLNEACEMIKDKTAIETSKNYDVFFENGWSHFLSIDEQNLTDYFGYARDFYKQQNFPAIQMVWTDKQFKFPWEEGFEKEYLLQQPLLDRNTDFKFFEEKTTQVQVSESFVKNKEIITTVAHHDDGSWEFSTSNKDTFISIALDELVSQDSTINKLFDLDYGQMAIRENKEAQWQRSLL